MFIKMVPDHRFNQLKPKSGARVGTGFARGTRKFCRKDSFRSRVAQHELCCAVELR
jgi:hypothetical protein